MGMSLFLQSFCIFNQASADTCLANPLSDGELKLAGGAPQEKVGGLTNSTSNPETDVPLTVEDLSGEHVSSSECAQSLVPCEEEQPCTEIEKIDCAGTASTCLKNGSPVGMLQGQGRCIERNIYMRSCCGKVHHTCERVLVDVHGRPLQAYVIQRVLVPVENKPSSEANPLLN